jgi:4-carboxymuconolactone decarboxylase
MEDTRIAVVRKLRREVLGASHVEMSGAEPTGMAHELQAFTVNDRGGTASDGPGLDKKTRSMLDLAMLSSMAQWDEFSVQLRSAVNGGLSENEIVEIIIQAGVCAGVPIAAEAFRIADSILAQIASAPDAKPDDR